MSHSQTFTAAPDGTSAVRTLTTPRRCPSPVARPHRVLIVDDVASTRRIVGAVLESCQEYCVVGKASDGRGAIEMAEALQPDFILLDMSMPFVDGTKALRGVRQVAPNAKVIIFSGVKAARGDRLVDAGAVGFIEKGISPFELLERLREILNQPSKVVLDPAVFDELRVLVGSSGEGLLKALVSQFVRDTEEWLIALREALEVSDTSAVGRISHIIKGSAAQLGGRRLALSCSRLEENATTGSLSDCRLDLGMVETDYRELRHELTDQFLVGDRRLRMYSTGPTGTCRQRPRPSSSPR
jgi:DNA-binding NarL/FixJ family response regulator